LAEEKGISMSTTPGTRKINKAERTRTKIIDTFLDLMSAKKWDKITVKELCESCSITRSTFYQYYSDIFDLMDDLETRLLEELVYRYGKVPNSNFSRIPDSMFIERFDYCPPDIFLVWFDFVNRNKKPIFALLDRKNGDSYFVKRLKQIMIVCIGRSMDNDGLPKDDLRAHFIKLLVEMHLFSAQIWIEDDSDDPLTVTDIVNLLNTTRVGACFLNYKSQTDPDYDKKMSDKFDQISNL
jgi:AcrR family transcriptional regulator